MDQSPQPQTHGPEMLPQPVQSGEVAPKTPEAVPDRPAETVKPTGDAVNQGVYGMPQAAIPLAPITVGEPTQQNAPTPVIHEAPDVIDKETVEKAKAIADRLKDDPNMQSSKMYELRREVVEKNYGKKLPSSDSKAA